METHLSISEHTHTLLLLGVGELFKGAQITHGEGRQLKGGGIEMSKQRLEIWSEGCLFSVPKLRLHLHLWFPDIVALSSFFFFFLSHCGGERKELPLPQLSSAHHTVTTIEKSTLLLGHRGVIAASECDSPF